MLTEQEATKLGRAIDELIAERGLGAISKKDYELLIFHHLASAGELKSYDNYLLANKLKVTETKIKSLRLESSIRHKPADHKAVLGGTVQRIIDEMLKPDFLGGMVSIALENPIDRREFGRSHPLADRVSRQARVFGNLVQRLLAAKVQAFDFF